MLEIGKRREICLDFKEERASFGRQGIHDYPAMFHYLVVRTLLERYGDSKKVFYDPFCGSGVALCEAARKRMVVYGTDINPMALLIAKVRCSNVNSIPLRELIEEAEAVTPDIPNVKNINYWFKDYVITDLGRLRSMIKKHKEDEYYELLLVVFSQTVKDVSNNRKGEFKRFRMAEKELKKFNPDVFETFEKNLSEFFGRMKNDPLDSESGKVFLHRADVRKKLPFDDDVDIIITSPPYGDSRTTVAYGQFFSFSFDWLTGLNPFGDANLRIDSESLGGRKNNFDISFSKTLLETFEKIRLENPSRAKEVASFYYDLFVACRNIAGALSTEGTVCFVVGNRTVEGVQIPTDDIVKEIFEFFGLKHLETLIREISRKRMPLLNAPSNIKGQKSSTMKHEYIVVLQK